MPTSRRFLADLGWYTETAPNRKSRPVHGVLMAERIEDLCVPLVGGSERVAYYEALRCMVQIVAVRSDNRAGRTNGWEHGVPALARHLGEIAGVSVPGGRPD